MNAHALLDSPIGPLMVCTDGTAVTGVYMNLATMEPPPAQGSACDATVGPLPMALRQLEEYFTGSRREFDLPLRSAGSAFQERVWRALLEIPYGVTWSYGALARRIDQPTASRAVGLANGRNPLSIVVPCHRVIGADGTLTGYGGGLERKRWLLAHEASH